MEKKSLKKCDHFNPFYNTIGTNNTKRIQPKEENGTTIDNQIICKNVFLKKKF